MSTWLTHVGEISVINLMYCAYQLTDVYYIVRTYNVFNTACPTFTSTAVRAQVYCIISSTHRYMECQSDCERREPYPTYEWCTETYQKLKPDGRAEAFRLKLQDRRSVFCPR